MSVPPDQTQQMLNMYRQQFPATGQPVAPLGSGVAGYTGTQPQAGSGGMPKGAATSQGVAQLITALMKAQKQKQLQQQLDQHQVNQAMPGLSQQSLQATNDMTQNMLQQNPVAPVTPGGQ